MRMKTRSLLILAVILGGLVMMVWLAASVPTDTELEIMGHADKHGLSYSDYPASLVELMERNPETRSFVMNYPFREEREADLSGYDPAQGIPLFLQWDEQWGYEPCGNDFVAVSGSGLMCIAMTGWHLSGGDGKFSPQKVAGFAREHGCDSGRRVIRDCGTALGLEITELGRDERKLSVYLQNGNPVIALMGEGIFGETEQYVVLAGYSGGTILVRDPGSRANSEKTWTYGQIAHGVKGLWLVKLAPEG